MDAPIQYLHELRGELSLYPTWLPSDPIELGAYGRFERGRFVVEGRLADLGIRVEPRAHEFKRGFQKLRGVRTSSQVGSSAQAGLIDLAAGASFEFQRAFAWTFAVKTLRVIEIMNIAKVQREVLDARRIKAWDDAWLLVTELREATGLRVMVARAQNTKVSVRGKGTVSTAEVLLAEDVEFEYRAEDVFLTSSDEPTTPLFALRKVQGTFSKELRATSSEADSSSEELLPAAEESFKL